MKIAHLSDLHWSQDRLADKKNSGEQIIDLLTGIAPDVIVVAGDSYDHSLRVEDEAARASLFFFAQLRDIAPVLVIKGNFSHDRNSVEALRAALEIDVSTVPEVYLFGAAGLIQCSMEEAAKTTWREPLFCTLPYPSSEFLAKTSRLNPEDMANAISEALKAIMRGFAAIQVEPGTPKCLVFHGTVPEAKQSSTQHALGLDIQLRLEDIEACGFDVVLAGHLHYSQRVGKNVFYPGGSCYTCWGDEGDKGFWLHTFREFEEWQLDAPHLKPEYRVQSEFIKVNAVPMRIVELDFSDPFWELPEWDDVYDVQIRLKMTEADRERYRSTDWKTYFPTARMIDPKPIVASVVSIRSEEVRKAHTLPEKVQAWAHQTNTPIATTLLDKAALVEDRDAEALLAIVQEQIQ